MFAKCRYCSRKFTLKSKKTILGQTKAINYVIVSQPNEALQYAHKKCYLRYKKNKIKEKRKFGVSGGAFGVNAGFETG